MAPRSSGARRKARRAEGEVGRHGVEQDQRVHLGSERQRADVLQPGADQEAVAKAGDRRDQAGVPERPGQRQLLPAIAPEPGEFQEPAPRLRGQPVFAPLPLDVGRRPGRAVREEPLPPAAGAQVLQGLGGLARQVRYPARQRPAGLGGGEEVLEFDDVPSCPVPAEPVALAGVGPGLAAMAGEEGDRLRRHPPVLQPVRHATEGAPREPRPLVHHGVARTRMAVPREQLPFQPGAHGEPAREGVASRPHAHGRRPFAGRRGHRRGEPRADAADADHLQGSGRARSGLGGGEVGFRIEPVEGIPLRDGDLDRRRAGRGRGARRAPARWAPWRAGPPRPPAGSRGRGRRRGAPRPPPGSAGRPPLPPGSAAPRRAAPARRPATPAPAPRPRSADRRGPRAARSAGGPPPDSPARRGSPPPSTADSRSFGCRRRPA